MNNSPISILLKKLVISITGTPLSDTFIFSLSSLIKFNTLLPDQLLNDVLLKERSPEALSLYRILLENESNINKNLLKRIVYTLLCLKSPNLSIEEELKINLKKGALGFNISYFNPVKIYDLKDKVQYSVYNIISVIYSKSLIYCKLKTEIKNPVNVIHKNFLEKMSSWIFQYESLVLEAKNDFLKFYSKMFETFQKLEEINIVSDLIKERRFFKNHSWANDSQVPLNLLNGVYADECVYEYRDCIFKMYNDCVRSLLLTGDFCDVHLEFFIVKNPRSSFSSFILDYGLIPPFICVVLAEDIAYIGNCTALLKSVEGLLLASEHRSIICSLDLSAHSCCNRIKVLLHNINTLVKIHFIDKFKIFPLFSFIHSTFLFSRSDFIEHLFNSLKESRNISKRNILSLLENSLSKAFGDSFFNSLMDIYILKDSKLMGDGFSIYIKVPTPACLIFDEEFVLKLVCIFRFLWKLKRIDHLARRLNLIFYINLIQRLKFYVHHEVIGQSINFEWDNNNYCLDLLGKAINQKVDLIMKNLFINTKEKRIERLFHYLESTFIGVGKGEAFNDNLIQHSLREFYDSHKESFDGTYMSFIGDFIKESV